MGGGAWTYNTFRDYTTTAYASKGVSNKLSFDTYTGAVVANVSNQELFQSKSIDPMLNPYGVMRECRDSDEHPHTKPVIICCDTTGSMGDAAVEVAKMLNPIMTSLYDKIEDVEFCIMGIGDLSYDSGPIQISQFESDIRIAEQLDKVWFEFGGGGNYFESYTAAWYMGSRHCDLDCWKRGEKGIIITIGDERLNPYLPKDTLQVVTGDSLQGDVETPELYEEVKQKFDVYHIQVNHWSAYDLPNIQKSFDILGENYRECNMDNITDTIVDIILEKYNGATGNVVVDNSNGIAW